MTTNTPAEITAQTPKPYNPVTDDWNAATEGADEVLGHDLAKEELLDALEGVPFLITRVTFRKGDFATDFVSCEVVIAPKELLERRRVVLTTLPFDPGDHVVFNDGSTGVRRQIVAYLYGKGYISLPDPVVIRGKAGECSFDLPASEWADVSAGEMRFTPTGDPEYTADVRILAKRGLRISDGYTVVVKDGKKEWEVSGKTRYLA